MKHEKSMMWMFLGAVACAGLPAFESAAQSFPARPLRMMIGFAPGGATDILGRLVAQKMSQPLGQTVIVENRTGAAGSRGIEAVVAAPADGHTLLFFAASITVLPSMIAKLSYDIERDLAPISLVATGAAILVVHPSVPAHNAKELIALARSRPGKLNYASSGIGSVTQLRGELMKSMGKVDIVHVPYKGSGDAVIATTTGEVDMSFPSIAAALPLMRANKIRGLAITSAKRSSLIPSMPTLNESALPGYDQNSWYAVWTRTGAPKDAIAKLHAATVASVAAPDLKEALSREGFEPQPSTPEELASLIRREIVENARLLKMIGVKPG